MDINLKIEKTDVVLEMCKNHPTCEGCAFLEEHTGCYFRGKTPREWDKLNEVWRRLFNEQ